MYQLGYGEDEKFIQRAARKIFRSSINIDVRQQKCQRRKFSSLAFYICYLLVTSSFTNTSSIDMPSAAATPSPYAGSAW